MPNLAMIGQEEWVQELPIFQNLVKITFFRRALVIVGIMVKVKFGVEQQVAGVPNFTPLGESRVGGHDDPASSAPTLPCLQF